VSYLLDVNALLAWEHRNSPHHAAFHVWARRVGRANLWTCGHTELGFIRVSMQVFGYSLSQAQAALATLRRHAGGFVALAPSPRLSSWAATAAKTSDAYLAQIARENSLRLATFDTGIAEAVVEPIPPVRP